MCRILALKSKQPLDIAPHLERFAEISKQSREYQGHGWGIAWWDDATWQTYHNINPVWEDNVTDFPNARCFLIHARSAFKDEGIAVENNMPFIANDLGFIFNGELRGVKIREDGRIGAEKIFNFIQRFSKYGMRSALDQAIPIIEQRSEYIRAMNFVISQGDKFYVSNYYNEQPDYFNLHLGVSEDLLVISSEPYSTLVDWKEIENYSVGIY